MLSVNVRQRIIAFESGVLGQAAAIEQMKRRDKQFARLLGDTGEDRAPAGVDEIMCQKSC
jgi:hypothetical protein